MADKHEEEVIAVKRPRLVMARRFSDQPPERMMLWRKAVRASLRVSELFRASRVWETIPRITQDFCCYFTDIIPTRDSTEPLIVKCLRTAADCWMEAANKRQPDNQCFTALLRGLFEHVAEVNGWCVHVPPDDDNVWDPASGSLSDWWRKQTRSPRLLRHEEYVTRISDVDLRLFIATRILSREDVSRLTGGLHELS